MSSNHIAISLKIDAPIQKVWDSLAQWEKQGEWMLQTKVWVTSEITEGVGTSINAFTGIGPLGVLDSMTVTAWQPPHTCDVLHTGKIIKGTGRFHLRELNAQTTIFESRTPNGPIPVNAFMEVPTPSVTTDVTQTLV